MLVPYAIIMIIPLVRALATLPRAIAAHARSASVNCPRQSPPGHVFAFSVLNRVFPGAVPSGFTAQRQDINDLYTRIAAEASEREMLSPKQRLRTGRLSRSVRWLRRRGALRFA